MPNCLYCGQYFPPKNNRSIFCSRDCANKDTAAWKKPPKKKKVECEKGRDHENQITR